MFVRHPTLFAAFVERLTQSPERLAGQFRRPRSGCRGERLEKSRGDKRPAQQLSRPRFL